MNDIMSTPGHSNYLEFGGSSANDQSGGSNNQNQLPTGQNQTGGSHHLEFHGLQTYHQLPMQHNRSRQFVFGDNQSHYSLQTPHAQSYSVNNDFIMSGNNDPNSANQAIISPSLTINSMIPLDQSHSSDPQQQQQHQQNQQLNQPISQSHGLHQQANQQSFAPFHPYGNPAMIFQSQPALQPLPQYSQPQSGVYNSIQNNNFGSHSSPTSNSRRPRLHKQTSSRSSKSSHSRTSSSSTIPEYPEVIKPKIATTYWEDAKTVCYQIRARDILVSRREDTNYINGTKLLNVIGMTRGKRDGILKAEKIRNVVKVGSMNLKGVWIPFERAFEHARNEGVEEILHPLFVKDLKTYYETRGHLLKSTETEGRSIDDVESGLVGSDNDDDDDNDTTLVGASTGDTGTETMTGSGGQKSSQTTLTQISTDSGGYSRPSSSGARLYLDSMDTSVSVKEEAISYYSNTEQTPSNEFKP